MEPKLRQWFNALNSTLIEISTKDKALSAQRYFPEPLDCYGANAKDIQQTVKDFFTDNSDIEADDTLSLAEYILENSTKHEMRLIAFALPQKFVTKHFDDYLLDTFQRWLEQHTDNWAQVDDLCMKLLYKFLLARPHLIEKTKEWVHSPSPWCRRASNVAWVKFVHRKIKSEIYQLDLELIFNNCQLLLNDKHPYVQKSIGWLLKVTATYHQQAVEDFIVEHYSNLSRDTLRYAIEKMPLAKRKAILALR